MMFDSTQQTEAESNRYTFECWFTTEIREKKEPWTYSAIYRHLKRLHDTYEENPLEPPEEAMTKDRLVNMLCELLENATPDTTPAPLPTPTQPGFSSTSLALSLLEQRLEEHRDGLKPLTDKQLLDITKILTTEKPTIDTILVLLNSLFSYLTEFYALTVSPEIYDALHRFLCDFRHDLIDDLSRKNKTFPTAFRLQEKLGPSL